MNRKLEILKARVIEQIAWEGFTHFLALRDENPSEVAEYNFAVAERCYYEAQFARRLVEGDADALLVQALQSSVGATDNRG